MIKSVEAAGDGQRERERRGETDKMHQEVITEEEIEERASRPEPG